MKSSIKTNDILMLFIAFDTLANDRHIPPDLMQGVGSSYNEVKKFLYAKGLINVEPDSDNEETEITD